MAEGLDSKRGPGAAAHRRFGNATRVRETFYDSTRPLWFDQAWILTSAQLLRSIARYPLAARRRRHVARSSASAPPPPRSPFRDVAVHQLPPPLYGEPGRSCPSSAYTCPIGPRASVVGRGSIAALGSRDRQPRRGAGGSAKRGPARHVRTGDRRQRTVGRARRHGGSVLVVLGVAACPRTLRLPGAPKATGISLRSLLSHRLWQRLFDERPDVLGATLWLNDARAHTVIGVLPQHFWFASSTRRSGLDCLPISRTLDPETAPGTWSCGA